MTGLPPYVVWRRRMLWLRAVLVIALALALLVLRQFSALVPLSLTPLLWLGALLLPNLLTLLTLNLDPHPQQRLLAVELAMDVMLFLAVVQLFGGASNPMTFYLLVPVLMAGMTLPPMTNGLVLILALTGYMTVSQWHHMPAPHTALHALTRELSALHNIGMAVAFAALAVTLSILGQVIQALTRQQQRQQDKAMELAGRRERMYQVAATLAHQAHELNTPLSSLVMISDNALQEPGLSDTTRADLEQIHALARQVAGKLRRADHHDVPEDIAFSALIDRLRLHLRHLQPTLEIRHQGPDHAVLKQASDWFRVLANLGYNAIDAGAGTLAIELNAAPEGWLLQISDDGPDHPERPGREGMGIGLALVESTLENLDARLEMEFSRQWTQARIRWSGYGA